LVLLIGSDGVASDPSVSAFEEEHEHRLVKMTGYAMTPKSNIDKVISSQDVCVCVVRHPVLAHATDEYYMLHGNRATAAVNAPELLLVNSLELSRQAMRSG
jgi:hypothetical protein